MKCKCPDGYPQLKHQDFGREANLLADAYGVPRPSFPKVAHTGECPLPDQLPIEEAQS